MNDFKAWSFMGAYSPSHNEDKAWTSCSSVTNLIEICVYESNLHVEKQSVQIFTLLFIRIIMAVAVALAFDFRQIRGFRCSFLFLFNEVTEPLATSDAKC